MSVKEAVLDQETLRRVNELCIAGARPPVIRALLPSFPTELIVNLWVVHNGKRPPKGPLPSNVEHYLSGPSRRLQSSLVLNVFEKSRAAGAHDIDALLTAYRQYVIAFGHTEADPYSFDRVWGLYRELISLRTITLVKCPCCNARYVHRTLEVVNHRHCPMRRYLAHHDNLVEAVLNPEVDTAASETGKRSSQSQIEVGVIALPYEAPAAVQQRLI
jgi:hypothetical protein